MTTTPKRFVGEPVELSRDCELGQEGERAVVTALDERYMTLHFPDRAPDCRDVHTGADYTYLRAYGMPVDVNDPITVVSMEARAKLNKWGKYAAKTMTPAAARRELRDLVATYLEGSDDAPRAAELLDALEPLPSMLSNEFWDRFKAEVQKLADEPITERKERERAMFGCTEAAIDEVLANKEPRDIAMYAMGALSNAQTLIQRDGDEPFAWSVRRADANPLRQLMNIAKYAIDKAVPRETSNAQSDLRARVQTMAKKFKDEVAQANASDDKSPFDEGNIEEAFALLEQLTKGPR